MSFALEIEYISKTVRYFSRISHFLAFVRSIVDLERGRGEPKGLKMNHGGINTNGFEHLELFLLVSRRLDAAAFRVTT
jgi:hypothetical protein